MKTIRNLAWLAIPFLLAGCGGMNLFGFLGGGGEEEKPAELHAFDEEVRMRRLWSVDIGRGQGKKFNRIRPAIAEDVIYAASNNGDVSAINRTSGNVLWRTRLDDDISGGVGVGGSLVLVGSENSRVTALERESGALRWDAEVSSEVLAPPASDGQVVVVQSVDGKLAGLDADTGEQLWIYENTVPALTLRGTSSPLIVDDFVIAGFGNGTVASIALDNGTLRWEERIAIPTGRSEIARMVDIDGELFLDDAGLLLAPSYQGYLAAIDIVTGQTRWRVQESSPVGAGSGFGNIYVSDERGHVKAYRQGQDEFIWVNDLLDLREVTAPVSFSNYVAVGDFEGYVHLLSQVDGRFVGRSRVDRGGVRVKMLARGNVLYVYGNGGSLSAYSVQ